MDTRSHAAGHRRRRRTLLFEGLEARDLPTAPTLLGGSAGLILPAATGPAQPSPHEVIRQAFVARFAGPFVTGPARLSDQAFQIYLSGGGNSSFFRHGDLQMSIFPSADPSQSA